MSKGEVDAIGQECAPDQYETHRAQRLGELSGSLGDALQFSELLEVRLELEQHIKDAEELLRLAKEVLPEPHRILVRIENWSHEPRNSKQERKGTTVLKDDGEGNFILLGTIIIKGKSEGQEFLGDRIVRTEDGRTLVVDSDSGYALDTSTLSRMSTRGPELVDLTQDRLEGTLGGGLEHRHAASVGALDTSFARDSGGEVRVVIDWGRD